MNMKGIIPAIPTPFTDSGALNIEELERMLAFLLGAGVHGIFAVGNAGEFYALDDDEKRLVLKTTLKMTAGKVPVIFGAGAATTAEAIRLAKMAEAEGADALSVITPFLIKPSEDELFSYYKDICAATRLPVLPYNNPAVTGIPISPALMRRLAVLDGIAGAKDSSGDLAITLEYLRISKPGFSVLAGRDGLILSTLIHGGPGAISSVASACPELAVAIYESYIAGDLPKAVAAQTKFAQLRSMVSLGTFPTVIKEALRIRGFDVGLPRAPVGPLAENKRKELSEYLHSVLQL